MLALKVAFAEDHLVWAGATFKAVDVGEMLLIQGQVIGRNGRNGEQIGATRTDCMGQSDGAFASTGVVRVCVSVQRSMAEEVACASSGRAWKKSGWWNGGERR